MSRLLREIDHDEFDTYCMTCFTKTVRTRGDEFAYNNRCITKNETYLIEQWILGFDIKNRS